MNTIQLQIQNSLSVGRRFRSKTLCLPISLHRCCCLTCWVHPAVCFLFNISTSATSRVNNYTTLATTPLVWTFRNCSGTIPGTLELYYDMQYVAEVVYNCSGTGLPKDNKCAYLWFQPHMKLRLCKLQQQNMFSLRVIYMLGKFQPWSKVHFQRWLIQSEQNVMSFQTVFFNVDDNYRFRYQYIFFKLQSWWL